VAMDQTAEGFPVVRILASSPGHMTELRLSPGGAAMLIRDMTAVLQEIAALMSSPSGSA
jgi:hypothetical protein